MTAAPRRRSVSSGAIRASTAAQGVLLLALATVAAVAALWPVYRGGQFLLLVAVTVAVASLLAAIGTRFRWPPHALGLAIVGVYLTFGVPLAVPDAAVFGVVPTPNGLGILLAGSVSGWKQLITVTLPVGSFEPLLVPAFIAILLVHTVSLSVALRCRVRQWALTGPLILFLSSIAVGTSSGFFPVFGTAVFGALAVLWLLWCRRLSSVSPGQVSSGLRRLAATLLVVMATIGGGVVSAVVAPVDGQRSVLRTAVTQRFDPKDRLSPLSGLRSFYRAASADAAMLTVRGLPQGARLRLATLSYYDGVVFSVGRAEGENAAIAPGVDGGSFALVPARIDQSAVVGRRIAIDITVDGYSDVWLPTVGALQSVNFADDRAAPDRTTAGAAPRHDAFYYDSDLRTAAVTAELSRGDSYRLTAVLPTEPRAEQLEGVRPARSGDDVTGPLYVPAGVRAALDRFTANRPTAGAKLQAALGALREEGFLSHGIAATDAPSRSGHSAGRITEFLSGDRMIGDAEQYAVTAAILAGQLGFPARVVVGFDPARAQLVAAQIAADRSRAVEPTPAPQPGSGVITVTGADMSAWIEVDTAEFGWVSLDPTPLARPVPEQKPQVAAEVARPQTVIPPSFEPPPVPADPVTTGGVQTPGDDAARMPAALVTVLWSAGVLLVLLCAVGGPVATIILAKAVRRRARQRKPGAREQVRESWNEFVDCARDHGYRLPPRATRAEIAAVVGIQQVDKLAEWADFASFAPGAPVTMSRSWLAVAEIRVLLGAGLGRRKRLLARLSLRSFGPRLGARETKTAAARDRKPNGL